MGMVDFCTKGKVRHRGKKDKRDLYGATSPSLSSLLLSSSGGQIRIPEYVKPWFWILKTSQDTAQMVTQWLKRQKGILAP